MHPLINAIIRLQQIEPMRESASPQLRRIWFNEAAEIGLLLHALLFDGAPRMVVMRDSFGAPE